MIIPAGVLLAAVVGVLQQPTSQALLEDSRDSVTFSIEGRPVEVRYVRRPPLQYPPPFQGPTLGGLQWLGGVAYGELWRDEPMTFVTPIALSVAGLDVPPGSYTLYALPGETEWTILVTRSLAIQGDPLQGDSLIQADVVGSVTVEREWPRRAVDTLTLRAEPWDAGGKTTALVLEWERTRLRIPVVSAKAKSFRDRFLYCARPGLRLFLAPPAGPCHPAAARRR